MQCNRPFVDASPTLRSIRLRTSNAMRQSLTLTLLLLLTACLLCSTAARAEETPTIAPTVIINPTVGPPTTKVLVSGSGFDPYAAVDIYFDLTDLALATTNGAGAFGGGSLQGGIAVPVPKDAVPGTHWITAVERYTVKAAQKSFLVRTDWAQFHFEPQHRGLNPYENVLSPATVGNMDLHWSYLTENSVFSSPAVANGVVYVGSNDYNLYALDAKTGALLWKYTTRYPVLASPAVANGLVYVGCEDMLCALNAKTGALLWKYSTGIIDSSPAVANGVVYVASLSNLYALDAKTGALLWKYPARPSPTVSPAVANGVVYIGSSDDEHNVYALNALNASTGALLWKYTTGGFVDTSPAVANGVVYVGSIGSPLYALNASTGALLWQYNTWTVGQISPTVANGVVYMTSYGDKNVSTLYALNASTGALLWKYTMGNSSWSPFQSSPAVANGVVYVGSWDGSLYALNASNGALLWQHTTGNSVQSSPAVANGLVYVGCDDGKLYAFGLPGAQLSENFSPPERPDPSLLRPDWKLQPSTPVTSMPSN